MNDNKTSIDEELDALLLSEEEADDLQCAFQRMNTPLPDIDGEWEKVQEALEEPSHRVHVSFRTVAMTLLTTACCAALFLLIWQPEPSFTARQENAALSNAIIMEDDEGHAKAVESETVTVSTTDYEDADMLSMSTPAGKDCHLILPDGTKVWLNAESELQFPARFTHGKRVVHLKGEAYFEVTKDASHPFVVKNEYFTTTVLGTSFNVNANSEKEASVVLVEGKVAVKSGLFSKTRYVTPGEKAVFLGNGKWDIHNEETYPYTQRKEGYFYFDNSSLRKIMAEIGRWFNKTVVFEDSELMDLQLHFVAERSETLQEIVDILNEMDGIDIENSPTELIVK